MKSSHSLNKDIIAFWGYVPENIVLDYKEKYPGATWVDLDVNTGAPELSIIPEASCRIIKNILDNNEQSVTDYKNGNDRAIKFLMGQIMKETKGNANPTLVTEELTKMLEK